MIISSQLLSAILQLAILLPFIFLGGRIQKKDMRFLAIFFIMFLLWSVLTNGLSLKLFATQQWNWAGKIAGIVLGLIFILRNKVISGTETGWTLKFSQHSLKPVALLLLGGLVLRLALFFALKPPVTGFDTETVLFQAIISPLSDEIIFRGILLALLNRVFLQTEDLMGFRMSRGVLITSLLFGLSQGFLLQNGLHLQISLIRILLAFICGIITALLKERSGSLLPAILFHSLWNVIGNH